MLKVFCTPPLCARIFLLLPPERLLTLSALPAIPAPSLKDSFQQLVAEVQQPPPADPAALQHTAALLEAEQDLLKLCRQELFVEETGAQWQQQQQPLQPLQQLQPQLLWPAEPSQVSEELQPPGQQQQETELGQQLQRLTAAMRKPQGLSSGDVVVRRFWRDYQVKQLDRDSFLGSRG